MNCPIEHIFKMNILYCAAHVFLDVFFIMASADKNRLERAGKDMENESAQPFKCSWSSGEIKMGGDRKQQVLPENRVLARLLAQLHMPTAAVLSKMLMGTFIFLLRILLRIIWCMQWGRRWKSLKNKSRSWPRKIPNLNGKTASWRTWQAQSSWRNSSYTCPRTSLR